MLGALSKNATEVKIPHLNQTSRAFNCSKFDAEVKESYSKPGRFDFIAQLLWGEFFAEWG